MPQRPLAQLGDAIDADQLSGADDPDAVGRMLHLVERVRGEEDRSALGRRLANESPKLLLKQRVEPAGRLVEDQERRPVHECLDEPELLAVALRELTDRAVEHRAEPLAELVAERRLAAAQAHERVELRAAGETVEEPEVSGQIPDLRRGPRPGCAARRARAARRSPRSAGSGRAGGGSSCSCRRRSGRETRRPLRARREDRARRVLEPSCRRSWRAQTSRSRASRPSATERRFLRARSRPEGGRHRPDAGSRPRGSSCPRPR